MRTTLWTAWMASRLVERGPRHRSVSCLTTDSIVSATWYAQLSSMRILSYIHYGRHRLLYVHPSQFFSILMILINYSTTQSFFQAHCAISSAYLMNGETRWFFLQQCTLQFSFFMAQWEEYYTHILPHSSGQIGVTEVSSNFDTFIVAVIHYMYCVSIIPSMRYSDIYMLPQCIRTQSISGQLWARCCYNSDGVHRSEGVLDADSKGRLTLRGILLPACPGR